MPFYRKYRSALGVLAALALFALGAKLGADFTASGASARSTRPASDALAKPRKALPYQTKSGRRLSPEERDAIDRRLYGEASRRAADGSRSSSRAEAQTSVPSAFELDPRRHLFSTDSLSGSGGTSADGAIADLETAAATEREQALLARASAGPASFAAVGSASAPAGEPDTAAGAGAGEAVPKRASNRGLALLRKLGVRSGELTGFSHGSRSGAADGREGASVGSASNAPAAGTGRAQTRTLFISAKNVDLFVDPASMESMPAGFSTRDLKKSEVSYKMGGGLETITVAKGGDLTMGEQVSWSGTESADGQWIQVNAGGVDAWIRKEQVSAPGLPGWKPGLATAFEIGKLEKGAGLTQIVAEAQRHVGDRYVWGGSAPGGFDCSGLVHYAYRKYGIQLPRVSRDQHRAAQPIKMEELEPGDLIFTGNPVKHVMMYKDEGSLVEAMGRKWGVVNSGLGRRTGGKKAVYFGTFRHLSPKTRKDPG
jgi:cell wall-associated NlpC family hydrolase